MSVVDRSRDLCYHVIKLGCFYSELERGRESGQIGKQSIGKMLYIESYGTRLRIKTIYILVVMKQ